MPAACCRDNAAQALTQWRHPVAFSVALNVLHQVMCPTSYHCIRKAIKIASNLPAFFVVNVAAHYHG
jgi:hypothetical protein